jgi:hypothetical protein
VIKKMRPKRPRLKDKNNFSKKAAYKAAFL